MSPFLIFSPEVFLATDNFSEFSINVAGIINARFASEGTVPFIGAGIGLNIPTSRTLSTELVLKGNIGVTLDDTFRIVAFYTTPELVLGCEVH